jgi:hypothetical protein
MRLWIHRIIPLARWVAPFGHPRITGRSPLPSAFRSVPRPSSPLGAKASTRCPSCAASAPSPEHALARARQRSAVGDQRSDRITSGRAADALLFRSPISDLSPCAGSPADARASARIPMLQARPHPWGRRPDLLHGHDSLHDFKSAEIRGRRSEIGSRTGPREPARLPTSAFDICLFEHHSDDPGMSDVNRRCATAAGQPAIRGPTPI